ncbi:MAG: HAD family hydrolase [Bdellovibrio sp.]|nr:HAD family hydrolase [Bdellovibrio sp.]
MSANHSKLNEIIKIAQDLRAQNLRTLAVFDLDSTLFNVSHRTKKILSEFAELHQLVELKNVEVKHEDWGINEAVLRAGYHPERDLEMLKNLRDFWFEKFFTNEYVHYDVPYAGAVSYVLELYQAGCEIKYLTGRDMLRMGIGSEEVLKKWGFPCEPGQLVLKPDRAIDDGFFKTDWFTKVNRTQYEKIYFFENEPVNINAVLATSPDVEIIFLETTHARRETVTAQLHRIFHFGRPSC